MSNSIIKHSPNDRYAAEKGAVEQVLSDAEGRLLFKALQKADRRHTIPLFIATLETGARWSSLVEFLKWKHVNFKAEEVTITTYKDKNMKRWQISVSTRLKAELLKLKLQRKSDDPDGRLFASASVNLRKVWEAARKDAGITSVRFHDLRHYSAYGIVVTRLLRAWPTLVWRCRNLQRFWATLTSL
jgi:integrase